MSDILTKVSEYRDNKNVFIRTVARGNPTVVVADEGQDLVEIDLNELIDAALESGLASRAIKEVECDCDDDIADAIRNHMQRQPFDVECSECGKELDYKANVDGDDDLCLTIYPCECTKEGETDDS